MGARRETKRFPTLLLLAFFVSKKIYSEGEAKVSFDVGRPGRKWISQVQEEEDYNGRSIFLHPKNDGVVFLRCCFFVCVGVPRGICCVWKGHFIIFHAAENGRGKKERKKPPASFFPLSLPPSSSSFQQQRRPLSSSSPFFSFLLRTQQRGATAAGGITSASLTPSLGRRRRRGLSTTSSPSFSI